MNKKLLMLTGSLLLIVILGQGYYLYRMSLELNELKSNEQSLVYDKTDSWPLHDDWFNHHEWNPFDEMEKMQDRLNQLLNHSYNSLMDRNDVNSLFSNRSLSSKVDLIDEGDRYLITVNIPNTDEADINVSINDEKTLTISGSTESKQETINKGQARKQHSVAEFLHSMTLPDNIKTESLNTEYKDGILNIYIDKMDYS